MRVALFGGSFNPPHRGHAWVIEYLLNRKTPFFDGIWIIPTKEHPFGKTLLPFAQRLQLCRLLIEDCAGDTDRCRVEDIENELPGESRTIDTLDALEERHPQVKFTLVLGSDLRVELPQWKNATQLKKRVDFLWIPRTGHAAADELPETPPISSTAVRDVLRRKRWSVLKDLLTPHVYRELKRTAHFSVPN